jgi:hypothetical protein
MNVTPGDLAIIVRTGTVNDGAIVTVLRWESEERMWWCRAQRRLLIIEGPNIGKHRTEAGVLDENLRRIPGPEVADETEREKELTA